MERDGVFKFLITDMLGNWPVQKSVSEVARLSFR